MTERRFTITWGERTFTVRGQPIQHGDSGVQVIAYASIARVVVLDGWYRVYLWHVGDGNGEPQHLDAHSTSEAADIVGELARRMEACR